MEALNGTMVVFFAYFEGGAGGDMLGSHDI